MVKIKISPIFRFQLTFSDKNNAIMNNNNLVFKYNPVRKLALINQFRCADSVLQIYNIEKNCFGHNNFTTSLFIVELPKLQGIGKYLVI